ACSSGEEAYSAAIALSEAGRSAEILASDIDTDALDTARRGVYRLAALEGIGETRLHRHFLRGSGANEGFVRVRPELCHVRFAQRNLLSDEWLSHERFDAIFCRNV